MNDEDCDENFDNDMTEDEFFFCCASKFQENTGLEIVCYEKSN